MILLDTNVISEVMRAAPDKNLLNWFQQQAASELHISRIVEAEVLCGIARLPDGRKRHLLERQSAKVFGVGFADKMLTITAQTPAIFAALAAELRAKGHVIGAEDTWIAAQALEHGAIVATRNVKHFTPCGVKVVNPFEG